MASIPAKGTVLKLDIASTLTAISHVLEFSIPKETVEASENPTLDQAGKGMPQENTGYITIDDFTATLLFHPDLAVHKALRTTHIVAAGVSIPTKPTFQIALASADAYTVDLDLAGFSHEIQATRADRVKIAISGKPDGLPVHTNSHS